MKRKKLYSGKIIPELEIASAAAEGTCVARLDNKVVFVEKAVPGDVADVKIFYEKKNWMNGKIENLISASPFRVKPECQHHSICGGCKWQQMQYSEQLKIKNQQVKDAFERIAKIEVKEYLPIVGCDEIFRYRNKVEFTFTDRKYLEVLDANTVLEEIPPALGFHVPGRFDKVFQVDDCMLADEFSNNLRNSIYKYCMAKKISFYNLRSNEGMMRNLIIRSTTLNQKLVIVIFAKNEKEIIEEVMIHIAENFLETTSLNFAINGKLNDSLEGIDVENYSGEKFIYEILGGCEFMIRPKSFFQTNTIQAEKLYIVAKNFADLKEGEHIHDLYCGTGTIGIFLSEKNNSITGIEYVEDAVKDAEENCIKNNITNYKFFAGDIAKIYNENFFTENKKPDVIITDPPRNGMHPDVVKTLANSGVETIVYISCNPATQARDLQMMSENYRVEKSQAVDMFPHTHHVENVVLLKKKL